MDRFGLSWRPELALGIHSQAPRIDVLEFLAEPWFHASSTELRTLAAWCAEKPVHLHGTTLGLASSALIDPQRLLAWSTLISAVRPEYWSEHLSFVRAGGIEIGHLAAPPRTQETVRSAIDNLARIRDQVGTYPLVENIATLIRPPGSDRSEVSWLSDILIGSSGQLLLDLHNFYANSLNEGWDAIVGLKELPIESIAGVHLAGGRTWHGRILDDHLHSVPDQVFRLLEELAALSPGPIDVILERDGQFPSIDELLDELDKARSCVLAGRQRSLAEKNRFTPLQNCYEQTQGLSSGTAATGLVLETLLARLYTDEPFRSSFLADPETVARAAGIQPSQLMALVDVDRVGLDLASRSLLAKRAQRTSRSSR